MWNIRCRVDAGHFPQKRTVVQFEFTDVAGAQGSHWLVGSRDGIELCMKNPGFEVDLFALSALAWVPRPGAAS